MSGISAAIVENTDVASAQPTRRNFFIESPQPNAGTLSERQTKVCCTGATPGTYRRVVKWGKGRSSLKTFFLLQRGRRLLARLGSHGRRPWRPVSGVNLSPPARKSAAGIESGFRDTKDLRFGMGMASIRVSTPERRDRLWLLNAFAVVLLTLLGAAGEALGYDRHLKSNTSKNRTHSLFRQGAMLYELIPTMPEPRLRPLVQRFGAMLLEIPVFAGVYGVI